MARKGDAKAPVHRKYLEIIRNIPRGRLMNYEGVSDFVGQGISLTVSHKLSELPENTDVPWWRIVGKDGSYGILKTSGTRRVEQQERLEAEGVIFDRQGRIILRHHLYDPRMPDALVV